VWKWLVGALVVCIAVCGGGGFFLARSDQGRTMLERLRPKARLPEVRLERVSRGELIRTVSAPGQIEPATNVKISAQVSARITALPFREGARVKEGDVVVRLDSRDLAALLESAQASLAAEQARLEGAKARLAQAEADLQRARGLFESKDMAQSALDAAEAEYLQAQANLVATERAIDVARANIARAEKDLDNAIITSPIDGVVTTLDAEVGETVVVGTLNNPGSVIMEIADLDRMMMRARVDESNIGPVEAGQRVKVYVNAYRDRVFDGVVELVNLKRKIDASQTGYFEVEIPIELTEKDLEEQRKSGPLLLSGLTGNCEIEVETLRDVIVVPSQAVLDRRVDELPREVVEGNQYVDTSKAFTRIVFRLVPDPDARPNEVGRYRTVATPVSIGPSDLARTVILGGLSEGDLIAAGPYKVLQDLKHDAKVAEEGTQKKDEKEKGEKKNEKRTED